MPSNDIRELMYGKRPVHRDNPEAVESEWYYIDPRYGEDDARSKIDVASENSPNPHANEIQNYLYNNHDEYNYKQLYGDTPPPEAGNIQSSISNTWQKIKDGASVAANTLKYDVESVGELAADAQIAKFYKDQMDEAGKKLVKTYGPGQGAGIDNYYHPLLQCGLAKISPTSKDWGIRLGYAKEVLDYHKKKNNMPMSEISADSRKDLQNNIYGSNIGYNNHNKSCWELLDDRRTPNMRKAKIR